jgi:anti-anti-sigma factor
MDIVVNKEGVVTTISLKGRLDALTSKQAEEQLLQIVETGERLLVMDLGELSYISSVGLRVLMLLAKRLKTVQGRVVVCSLQESIQQVFEIAGFTTIFGIYASRDEAVIGVQ